ncbi:hypothetical protein [Umezawaea tangerina]|uniref:HAF family extracellular repeat protein n=1 Tax=Umezawaea tangerina TaxID=84725 RepID=A0A2T0SXB8_9PSEU|nr:hypothetical protein [Umezawaea tangerina]PRY38055.1 hypothetical protein CLV43_109275 [Umezawaea tangerina]
MRFGYPVAVALVLAVISPPTASAATCTWTPTPLPLPAGMTTGEVRAADSQGGYAGQVAPAPTAPDWSTHVVRWSGGAVTDYGTVPGFGPFASVTGANGSGVVVGSTYAAATAHDQAFRSVGTALRPLPEPAGATDSWATAVNDGGDVVGYVARTRTTGGSSQVVHVAVLWPANAPGTVVELTGLPTTGHTEASGVDQDGTILVEHFTGSPFTGDATALYLWRAGTARALPVPAGTSAVAGNAISAGRVVGASTYSTNRPTGALWEQGGTFAVPTASTRMSSVNRTGQSVGYKEGSFLSVTYSVWQGTAKVGSFPGGGALLVSADNGTVAGWTRADPNAQVRPAYFRCL